MFSKSAVHCHETSSAAVDCWKPLCKSWQQVLLRQAVASKQRWHAARTYRRKWNSHPVPTQLAGDKHKPLWPWGAHLCCNMLHIRDGIGTGLAKKCWGTSCMDEPQCSRGTQRAICRRRLVGLDNQDHWSQSFGLNTSGNLRNTWLWSQRLKWFKMFVHSVFHHVFYLLLVAW